MKTITTTQLVPADEVTTTSYGCEHCDFTTDDPDDVASHHGREHSCKGEVEAGGETLHKFDSEDDAKAWMKVNYGELGMYRAREVDWTRPGWYAVETYTEPCPRGCCTDHCARLFPAERLVWDVTRRARRIMQDVTAIRRALREAGCEC